MKSLSRITSRLWPLRRREQPGQLSGQQQVFLRHQARVFPVAADLDAVGQSSGLSKKNFLISDTADLHRFIHYLAYIYHRTKLDPRKPALILYAGMLCNSNLFRMPNDGADFKDLDQLNSLANQLALAGFPVIILNRRDSEWIYTRFVQHKLGVANHFGPPVDFRQHVNDLDFLIDAALSVINRERAVVCGFSLGGILLINLLAFRVFDPRIVGLGFMATPVEFKENEFKLKNMLRIYSRLARVLPFKNYHALNLLANNLHTGKKLVKRLGALDRLLFLLPIFYPPNTPLETLIPILSYVVEPHSPATIQRLLAMFERGDLFQQETGHRFLEALAQKDLPPALVIDGARDRLVSTASHELLVKTLGAGTREIIIPEVGHVDLITGAALEQTVKSLIDFADPGAKIG